MSYPDSKKEIYKWVKTAYHYKEKVKENWWTFKPARTVEDNWARIQVPLWIIKDEDVNSILRYALEWKVRSSYFSSRIIPSELQWLLKAFQDKFQEAFDNELLTKEVFWIKESSKDDIYLLWGWDYYSKYVDKDESYTTIEDNETIRTDCWFFDQTPKKQKELVRKAINNPSYLNKEMRDMEKRLRKNMVCFTRKGVDFSVDMWYYIQVAARERRKRLKKVQKRAWQNLEDVI